MGAMTQATVTSKGQLTVPVEVRRALGLRPGSKVEFVATEHGAYELTVKQGSIQELKGMFPAPAVPVTLEQMDDAIAEGAIASLGR